MTNMEMAFEKAGIKKPVVKEPAQTETEWQVTKEIAAEMGVKL